ncbi:hypothetical protein GCM10009804_62290 [Kribbella hippodromi]|uniref:Glycosyl transferase family 2 n=1 Tax=Kribbella hippodromi TaxID=434347 RepID=A0ABN2E7E3_9ACTN
MSRPIKHGTSHASLLHDVSAITTTPKARSRLDAIVVPAARPASALQDVITLSIELSVPLVILCSRQAQLEQVVARVENVEKNFGAKAVVVEVPENYRPPCDPPLTSGPEFREVSAGRSSDLSAKRNIGLLLGRMRGWNKILFVDDDISRFNRRDVDRLTGYLDRHPVASMVSREYPDNSVVCHARRLAGFKQDVFVSGAALGVNLKHPELSFFADVYNEDWFFFARQAANRSLPKIGEVRQLAYEPFADQGRADREEFGDLLAEGLYGLFETTPHWSFKDQLAAATVKSHWRNFATDRLEFIQQTLDALDRAQMSASPANYLDMLNAQASLLIAAKRASSITPDLCVDFIEKWQEDEVRWRQMLRRFPSSMTERDALAELQLPTWALCGYGQLAGVAGTA